MLLGSFTTNCSCVIRVLARSAVLIFVKHSVKLLRLAQLNLLLDYSSPDDVVVVLEMPSSMSYRSSSCILNCDWSFLGNADLVSSLVLTFLHLFVCVLRTTRASVHRRASTARTSVERE